MKLRVARKICRQLTAQVDLDTSTPRAAPCSWPLRTVLRAHRRLQTEVVRREHQLDVVLGPDDLLATPQDQLALARVLQHLAPIDSVDHLL